MPKLPFIRLLLVVALALGPVPGIAQEELDLYSFERVVLDQAKATREAVLADALTEVLVRVTGDRQAPNSASGKNLIARAVSLLQQYDYFKRPVPPLTSLPAVSAEGAPVEKVQDEAPPQAPQEELVLHGRFDENAINKELRKGGLPIWGRVRPRILAAVLLRELNTRLLTAETPPEEVKALTEIAQQRGVGVSLPDNPGSAPEALWNAAPDALAEQFKVSGANVLLRGRITHVGDTWGAGWSLVQSGRVLADWEHYAATLGEVLANAAHTAADTLAAHYAVKNQPGQESFISLRISGVRALADYARVQKYLDSLTVVDKAELLGVAGDALLYRVSAKGDATALERALQLGKLLAPDPAPAGPDLGTTWGGELRLNYRLTQPAEGG